MVVTVPVVVATMVLLGVPQLAFGATPLPVVHLYTDYVAAGQRPFILVKTSIKHWFRSSGVSASVYQEHPLERPRTPENPWASTNTSWGTSGSGL